MRYFLLTLTVMGGLLALSSSAQAKLNIFACAPEWAALAEEIGGTLVNVTSATHARQDIHYLRAKPSFLAAMRKADLVVCTGAGLEAGWLPILTKKAGGPNVQPETIGWIMAADYVEKIEVMEVIDRSQGHIHPEGNPHIHLDPANIQIIAEVLADRLLVIDRENARTYIANLKNFSDRWAQARLRWDKDKLGLSGKKVIVYHKHWAYMLRWLGLDTIASLEPKPGLPPSAAHLETILKTVQDKPVHAIILAPFEKDNAAAWLSKKSAIPVVRLPYTVGGSDQAHDLISLFDETIKRVKDL